MNKFKNYLDQQPGYKVVDSHFKLGSKIHISDFYYAKRMFQNSFFATRYALLTAEYILKTHKNLFYQETAEEIIKKQKDLSIQNGSSGGVSLVGYGLYSALLLSLIEYLLQKRISSGLVNHGIIKDYESLEFVDNIELNENVIIIVPIASTFSTSVKIFESLKKKNEKKIEFLSPDVNILFVSNGMGNNEKIKEEKYSSFGISFPKEIETTNVLDVKILSDFHNESRKQKYFTELPTTWYINTKCELCGFDNDSLHNENFIEFPLYSTDESSVTPSVIFKYPNARKIEQINYNYYPKIEGRHLDYGHIEQYNNHLNLSVDISMVFIENKDKVANWLQNIKNEFKYESNVLIIAAGHPSNTEFVNMVNRIVFNSSANILHFNPEIEHLQNFELIYSGLIINSKVRYFIDTELTTGLCFQRINYYIRTIMSKSDNPEDRNRCFDSSLFLLNRSSQYNNEHVKRNLAPNARIFSWLDFHLPVVKPFHHKTVLEAEYELLQNIYKEIHIQRLTDYYCASCIKLAPREPFQKKAIGTSKEAERQKRIFYFVIANHILFSYFDNIENQKLWHNHSKLDDFISAILRKPISAGHIDTESQYENIKNSFQFDLSEKANAVNDLNYALIKALCYAPFKNYLAISTKMLLWLIVEFKELLELISKKESIDKFDYSNLRFYIKRLVLLDSNFVLSKYFFEKLKSILDKILKDDDNNHKCKRLISFIGGQIKYLITKNPSKSVNLDRIISNEYSKISENCYYSQLLRILIFENSILISNFVDILKDSGKFDILNEEIEFLNSESPKVNQIKEFCNNKNLESLNSYFLVNKYISIDIESNKKKFDQNTKNIIQEKSIKEKISNICKEIINILPEGIKSDAGLFLLVTNKTLIENKSFYKAFGHGIISQDYASFKALYETLFIDKEKTDTLQNITIIEFAYIDSQWKDIQSTNENTQVLSVSKTFIPEKYNRLLLIRISKNRGYEEHESNLAKGVIGICFNAVDNKNNVIDPFLSRYLLWLAKPLSKFIENHMENEEFQEWQKAKETERISLLTGHGKDVLLNLSNNEKNYDFKTIVRTLLIVQLFVRDYEEFNLVEAGTEYTVENFKKFVSQSKNNILDIKLKDDLIKLCSEVFKTEYVECSIHLVPEISDIYFIENTDYKFPKDILLFIIFELLFNAKKNRYIFSDFTKIIGFDKNEVYITLNKDIDDNLTIEIKSSGSLIEKDTIDKLNLGEDVKQGEDPSGTYLIFSLLKKFNLGKITFDSKPDERNAPFNIVMLTLYKQ